MWRALGEGAADSMEFILIVGAVLAVLWLLAYRGWNQGDAGYPADTLTGTSGIDAGVVNASNWGCFAIGCLLPLTLGFIIWILAVRPG